MRAGILITISWSGTGFAAAQSHAIGTARAGGLAWHLVVPTKQVSPGGDVAQDCPRGDAPDRMVG